LSAAYHFTRLVLVRHAQARSADGLYGPDTPLSDLGREQARLLSAGLTSVLPISALYCSPLPRAVETAAPLAERLSLAPSMDARLGEFEMERAPLDALASRRDDILLWRPEQRGSRGGETIAVFLTRVGQFCAEVCERNPDRAVAVVTHAGAIDAVYRWALDIQPTEPWVFEVEVPNASVSEIAVWPHGRMDGGPPRLAVLYRVGDVSHLGGRTSAL